MDTITVCGVGFLLGISFYFGTFIAQKLSEAYSIWYWEHVSSKSPLQGIEPKLREEENQTKEV